MSSFLKDSFYDVNEVSLTDTTIKAIVSINPAHPVFKGHFPQMPVVPGVCQVQMIKELLEENTGTTTMMVSGDNIKFTGMILPDKNPVVNLEINYTQSENIFVVDAKLFFGDQTFTKYKGKFKILK